MLYPVFRIYWFPFFLEIFRGNFSCFYFSIVHIFYCNRMFRNYFLVRSAVILHHTIQSEVNLQLLSNDRFRWQEKYGGVETEVISLTSFVEYHFVKKCVLFLLYLLSLFRAAQYLASMIQKITSNDFSAHLSFWISSKQRAYAKYDRFVLFSRSMTKRFLRKGFIN